MISDDCFFGYILNAGDIPVWGQIGTNPSDEVDISRCARRCNNEPECCSFEYSETTEKCNLNTGCAPTSEKFEDYSFCVKGMYKM